MGVAMTCAASPSSPASLAVLTSRALFLHVASFQSGLPGFAVAFKRRHGWRLTAYACVDGVLPLLAIEVDDVEMLERLYREYELQRTHARLFESSVVDPRLSFEHAMTSATERSKLQALAWLHEHTDVRCGPKTLAFAATLGHFEVVKWLAQHRPDASVSVTTTTCDAMVLTGDLELVAFMVKRFPGLVLTTDAMDYAAAQGHLEIVKFLHARRTEGCTSDAMDHAARCGRLDIVQFLHENRTEGCTHTAMDYAAGNGHLAVVEFLHEHRQEGCTVHAMDEAAKNGHLDVVKFLHCHRTEGCTTFAMDMAAWNERLDVLEFLHQHRREGFTPMAIGRSAQLGLLDVVRFLHEHQTLEVHCHEDALHEAARFGHLEVVQYLVENCTKGCLVTARKCADERDFTAVIAFLNEHIDASKQSCSVRQHGIEEKTRRCQKSPQKSQSDDVPSPAAAAY